MAVNLIEENSKAYKDKKSHNIRMFPSDPTGSPDESFSFVGGFI